MLINCDRLACRAEDERHGTGLQAMQATHLSDTTDVLFSVLGGEAEVLVQAKPDVVSVESERPLAELEERGFEGDREG